MTDEKTEGGAPDKPVHRKTPPATPAVQAWLDGEVARDGLATDDEQETAELWSRINKEAEQLRNRQTPIHVQSRILSSLPATPTVTEDLKTPSRANPIALVIGGLAMVALGALIGFMLMR